MRRFFPENFDSFKEIGMPTELEQYELDVAKHLMYPELENGETVEEYLAGFADDDKPEPEMNIGLASELVVKYNYIVKRCFQVGSFAYYTAQEIMKREEKPETTDVIQEVDNSGENITDGQ